MSETLGTRITYKGRTYLDGSITGNEFATSMTGTIDNQTRVLTLQLKNGENDLGEPIEITIPTQELTSTDYATDINFSLDANTGVLSVQLKNEDGDTIGTAKTVIVDNEPTENSTNLITSGSIYNAISSIESTLGDINTALEGML